MSSEIKVSSVKAKDGTAGISIADSTGNVSLSGSLSAGTIGGDVAMASSGLTVRNMEQIPLPDDQYLNNSTAETTFFTPTYTPKFSGSKVMGCLNLVGYGLSQSSQEGRKKLLLKFSGSDITDITYPNSAESENIGSYDYGGSGIVVHFLQTIFGPLILTSGTSQITCTCTIKNLATSVNIAWQIRGSNDEGGAGNLTETYFTWIEYK